MLLNYALRNHNKYILIMVNIKKGQLLISEPSFTESIFYKSVILILHHDINESIGLILNQPSNIKLNKVINGLPLNKFKLNVGGPVENNTLHFIHTLGQQIPDTKKIEKGIYWGGDFDTVKKLIIEKKISVNDIRFFIGYSGWSKNQLINEINNNNWIIHNDETKICMQNSNEKLWSKLIKTKSRKHAIWANIPKDPSMN